VNIQSKQGRDRERKMEGSKCPPFWYSGKYYHQNSEGSSMRQSSFFEGKLVLNQGVGYSVILGFGAFFAVFTSLLVCSAVVIVFFYLFCSSIFFLSSSFFHTYTCYSFFFLDFIVLFLVKFVNKP